MATRTVMIRRKRDCSHRRAEVGTTDPDIDDIGVAPALPRDLAAPHGIRERLHALKRLPHAWHDVLPVDLDRTGRVAERGVQHRPPFGFVDLRARKHRLAPASHVFVFGEVDQRVACLGVDIGLGIIE